MLGDLSERERLMATGKWPPDIGTRDFYATVRQPIPVTERLPASGIYLGWVSDNRQWQYLSFNLLPQPQWFRFTSDGCVDLDQEMLSVTHWLPLPPPPVL
jgi:hypothetical protein